MMTRTQETYEKMSESLRGHKGKLGWTASDEVRERMSTSASRHGTIRFGFGITNEMFQELYPDAEQAGFFDKGYDFILNGKKIDVKGATQGGDMHWHFSIKNNKIADFFYLMLFDSRPEYNLVGSYMIPGAVINHLTGVSISENAIWFGKWKDYEGERRCI